MSDTISFKLYQTLQKGVKRLSKPAARFISCFVESQRTEECAFLDRGGQPDLYYTSFGWMLSSVLGIKTDRQKMTFYLAQQNVDTLDLVHYAAYARCQMLRRLMTEKWLFFLKKLQTSHAPRSTFNFPHSDSRTPYSQFIRYSLDEDFGCRITNQKEILASLASYRLPEGGYANTLNATGATINATVAALAVKGQIKGYKKDADTIFLCNRQEASGGFAATEASPTPDLLSTATALFILHYYGETPRYSANDFIDAHWLDSGGFAATLTDTVSDVEYTFYGLLALGATK